MWRKPTEVQPSSQPYASPNPSSTRSEESPKSTSFQPQGYSTPAASLGSVPSSAAPNSSNISKISSGLKIQGDVSGSSDLYIDGDVTGKIRLSNARVTVGPNGRVQAEIEARDIVVDGSVQGNLKAGESARFGSSSRVVGSVLSPRIGIEDGARLRGKIETVRAPQASKSPLVESSSESEDLSPVATGIKSE
jgi:cytoskeletal protein CcmA (bactofilin family)